MAYDSYSDTSASEGPDDSTSEEKNDAKETSTALLPKSLFGGHDCKPGDKYTVEVVHTYEDEIEVKHVGGKASSDKSEEE